MKLSQTSIPDLVIIEPFLFHDERGWFMESFNMNQFQAEFKKINKPFPAAFVQDNYSCSHKNVLRGLHYQHSPHTQAKLVQVTKGAVFDVAVDIRENSPTFGHHVGLELSATNKRMLWIPEGFAHGFLTLEDDTHFVYKTTEFYNQESEAIIKWNDSDLAIAWPITDEPILNQKDSTAPTFKDSLKYSLKTQAKGIIDLSVIGDNRGSLVALENKKNVPFDIKRVYYLFDIKKEMSRGFHAHKHLKQIAVCVSGSCRMLLDDGQTRESFWLDSPSKGLFINNMMWREMHDFSENCVLMVLASENYDEGDYIRNYEQFMMEAFAHDKVS